MRTGLHVVLEDGHKNAGDAVRMYNWAKNRTIAAHALAGLTFDNKRTCLPLASADLFAYLAWGKEVGQKPIGIAKKRIKSEASYRGNLFRIMLTQTIYMICTSKRFNQRRTSSHHHQLAANAADHQEILDMARVDQSWRARRRRRQRRGCQVAPDPQAEPLGRC